MQEDQQHFECSNPFQNRIPNLVIIALVASTAVNETVTQDPFAFQKFGLFSIKQYTDSAYHRKLHGSEA